MNLPNDLKYAQTHEWVQFTPEHTVRVGITDFAQQSLGSLVFVNLPQVGDRLTAGASLGDVESVKSVSEILSPVSGTVTAVNEALLDHPEQINDAPYESWLVEIGQPGETRPLMDAAAYAEFCAGE